MRFTRRSLQKKKILNEAQNMSEYIYYVIYTKDRVHMLKTGAIGHSCQLGSEPALPHLTPGWQTADLELASSSDLLLHTAKELMWKSSMLPGNNWAALCLVMNWGHLEPQAGDASDESPRLTAELEQSFFMEFAGRYDSVHVGCSMSEAWKPDYSKTDWRCFS